MQGIPSVLDALARMQSQRLERESISTVEFSHLVTKLCVWTPPDAKHPFWKARYGDFLNQKPLRPLIMSVLQTKFARYGRQMISWP